MSPGQLPVEIFIEILSNIRTSKDSPSEPTLVSCLQANSVLRAAALASRVWKKPYRVRYTHSDHEREQKRKELFGGDWRLMYYERRRIDKQGMDLLAEIREQRSGRHDRARRFTQELSFDVWDALKQESELMIPHWFREELRIEGNAAENALPRQFWARTAMGIITRYQAIKMWTQLLDDPSSVSFEQGLAGLSAFFDTSLAEVNAQLEDVCTTCRRRLAADGVVLDPDEPGYNFWHLCEKIRQMIQQLGFRLAEGPRFYTLMNQFPHAFLAPEYHETIPMSLVYVFVAVARRLGIDASPANFPGVVQARIQPPDPSERPRLLDMRASEMPILLSDPATLQDLPDHDSHTQPASASTMLSRASNNIIMFMRYERTYGDNISLPWSLEAHEAAFYATSCWVVMESQQDNFIPCPPESKPLDVIAVVLDAVCPALEEIPRNVVSTYCYRTLELDEEKANEVSYRSMYPEVKHFVGLLFKHKRYNYAACVFGWDPICKQARHWIEEMNVDSLPNGRNQPFYHVFATDGHPRYVAQDNIVPSAPSKSILPWLHSCRSAFGRYFVDVDMDEATGLGRLIPSKELQSAYPEDEQYGANWTHGWLE